MTGQSFDFAPWLSASIVLTFDLHGLESRQQVYQKQVFMSESSVEQEAAELAEINKQPLGSRIA